jgi:hypothetical protein
MNLTYEEVYKAVGRVQSQNPEFAQMPEDHQKLTASIATVAAQTVLELLNNKSSDIITVQEETDFPVVFAEWAQRFTIKTHFDRFLAVMLWFRERESLQEVTTADITYMYEKARWKKPANFADVFSKGADKLYFTTETESEDGLKQWRMTRTGYDYITNMMREV